MSPAAVVADGLVGELVGNYRIEALIGAGGMGRVYRAVHPEIDRAVAIKVLAVALSADDDLVRRFRREAQAVTRIRHPNIVDILDFGALPDGRPFYTMELLDGESLHTYLKRAGRLPVGEALAILDPVLAALEAAHAAGVIHRDLKPDNVFLRAKPDGIVPTLLDFGVAKLADPLTGGDARHTQTGALLGTPAYMSPEQASGQTSLIGPPSDIYSVGVMAYEMLSGVPPFQAAHLGELILQHLQASPVALRQHCPEASEDLEHVIHWALSKDPAARPQTVTALRRALQASAPSAPLTVLQFAGSGSASRGAPSTPRPLPAPAPAPARQGTTVKTAGGVRPWLYGAAAVALIAGVTVVVSVSQRRDSGIVSGEVQPVAVVVSDAAVPVVVAMAAPDAGAPPTVVTETPQAGAGKKPPAAKKQGKQAAKDPVPEQPPRDEPTGDAEFDTRLKAAKGAALRGDYAEALTLAESALARRPGDQDALFTAGHAACMGDKPAVAKKHYASLRGRFRDVLEDVCARWKGIYLSADAEASPAGQDYRRNRRFEDGNAAYDKGDYAGALALAEEMLQERPNDQNGINLAALASCMRKDVERAKRYIAKATASRREPLKQLCKGQGVDVP